MLNFDQTTLCHLLNKVDKYKDKVDSFKDNLRCNYYPHYEKYFNDLKDPIVIRHYSSYAQKDKPYVIYKQHRYFRIIK